MPDLPATVVGFRRTLWANGSGIGYCSIWRGPAARVGALSVDLTRNDDLAGQVSSLTPDVEVSDDGATWTSVSWLDAKPGTIDVGDACSRARIDPSHGKARARVVLIVKPETAPAVAHVEGTLIIYQPE